VNSMARWIKVRSILDFDISLQEQIEWAENGLSVYNNKGQKVIEKGEYDNPPKGCTFLKNNPDPYSGSYITYFEWNESHDYFKYFQYKSDELFHYLSKNNQLHLLPHSFIETNSPILENSCNKPCLSLQSKNAQVDCSNHELNRQHFQSTIISHNIELKSTKTCQAINARKQKASQEWSNTLEKAVSLAVECARKGKPKSTEQHKEMWRKIFDQQGVSLPRKEGFEAFRRGLPDDLKGTS
jgi:hypothetical protein